MEYYVSAGAYKSGCGDREHPFKTISEAAAIAMPGDVVTVAPGVYREYVDPKNGGTKEQRIIYRSEEPLGAIISGAEKLDAWERYKDEVWRTSVGNGLFGDYNPYMTEIFGDWYWSDVPVHTGELYLNGTAMYEAMSLDEVISHKPYERSWEGSEVSSRKWFTTQENGETVFYAYFGGKDPNRENIEFNVRRNCFYPSKEGNGYITLSGFVIKQAATQWAPPTAYQDGMVGPHWSKGWVIEDCEISHSRCSGITLGKYLQPQNNNKWSIKKLKDGTQTERDNIMQAQAEGWSKETVGSHIVRRCNIHDCGQTGIVGHLGGVFSIIEDNHIHHINNKQDLAGAEIGGIKMHAAIDVIYRRNHIHHCTRGLWLDWQAQGTRVTANLFHDNTPPKGIDITPLLGLGEDIFIEVSHGPTLIDNNLLLSPCSCRISTQGMAFVHNLIAGSFTWVGEGTDNNGRQKPTPRYTPYHIPHQTEVAGFMTIQHGDMRFYNNIFVQQPFRDDYVEHTKQYNTVGVYRFVCGTDVYDEYPTEEEYLYRFTPEANEDGTDRHYDKMPVICDDNWYFNGAKPWKKEKTAHVDSENTVEIDLSEKDGKVYLKTDVFKYLNRESMKTVSTEILGEAFEPEQRFENPDGTAIIFNEDYFGEHRGVRPLPGPFENEIKPEKYLF